MTITKDKMASVAVFAVLVALGAVFVPAWGLPAYSVFVAAVVSLLGLGLIWFAEPLSETGCFSRGVPLSSPPILVEAIGWLFLVGYPLLLVLLVRTAPAWSH